MLQQQPVRPAPINGRRGRPPLPTPPTPPVIALGRRQVAQLLRALVRLLVSVGVEVGRDHLGDLGLEPGDGPDVAPLHRSLHALQEALEGDVECEAVDDGAEPSLPSGT